MTSETKIFLESMFNKLYNSVVYFFPDELSLIEDIWKRDLKEISIQYAESTSKFFNPERGEEKTYFATVVRSYILSQHYALTNGNELRESLKEKYNYIFRDYKLDKLINDDK